MATIATGIQLYDRVSAPINNMLGAINNIIYAFESVENSMDGAFNTSDIDTARSQMQQATAQMVALGQEIEENEQKQDDFNDEVEKSVGLGAKLKTVLGGIGLYFGLSEIKSQVTQAINYVSDLQEVQNVVDVAFGGSAKIVDEWAETTLEAYGLNQLSAKRFAGTMGAMLKSSGMSGQAVSDMSMKITELAGDMASFYNLEGEEAFNKLRSGISGETEPLKQLGINMSVANLEAFALSQGIKKSYNEMSQAEQVMLRYNYLMQTTQDAQGDFARTSDSFANQTKLLSENWKEFTGELVGSLLPILAGGIRMLNGVVSFMAENWSIISPILAGVAAAIALVNAPLLVQAGLWLWNSVLVPAYTAVLTFLKIGYGVLTGATGAAATAQATYNSALLACPLTWILLIIIAVIAVIYAVIAAINKVTGKTISATGVIVGALMAAVAFIWNLIVGVINGIIQFIYAYFVEPFIGIVEWILNVCQGGFDSFGGAVANLIGQIIGWFLSLGQVVTKIIDAIFGTNWTGGLEELKSKVIAWGKTEDAITLDRSTDSMMLQRWEYGDAYNKGYEWGANLGGSSSDEFDMNDLLGDKNAQNLAETAENTGKAADALDITAEDLKYLRDIAERDVINRFTTAEIKVEMQNNNTINSDMDLDGVVDYLASGVNEAMEKAAEGVHV